MMQLVNKYGDRNSFLNRFTPDYQRQICADVNKCIFGDYPTLTTLKDVYGNNTPAMWLIPQLYTLSEYCGCKDKLQGKPLEECAFIIATEFYFLKISELMLFFHRFKAGRYGRFYGSVDPLVITTALREFLRDRNLVYDQHRQEQEECERDKRSVDYERWKKNHGVI